MNELQEIEQNIQDNIITLKDVLEELTTDLTRLRAIRKGPTNLLEMMQKANQVHIEDLNNESIGDMQ